MIRQTFVLRAPKGKSAVLQGESFVVETPKEVEANNVWAMEPWHDTKSPNWFDPQEVVDKDYEIEINNSTDEPIVIGKHSHVCQIRSVENVTSVVDSIDNIKCANPPVNTDTKTARKSSYYSETVSVNPDGIASRKSTEKAIDIGRMYDRVFHPNIPLYNSKGGNINMGAVMPPQRKARLPQYNHEKLVIMQEKYDELERQGVSIKPEDVGVTAEYIDLVFNPGTITYQFEYFLAHIKNKFIQNFSSFHCIAPFW